LKSSWQKYKDLKTLFLCGLAGIYLPTYQKTNNDILTDRGYINTKILMNGM
jgi:hypothetical protein